MKLIIEFKYLMQILCNTRVAILFYFTDQFFPSILDSLIALGNFILYNRFVDTLSLETLYFIIREDSIWSLNRLIFKYHDASKE